MESTRKILIFNHPILELLKLLVLYSETTVVVLEVFFRKRNFRSYVKYANKYRIRFRSNMDRNNVCSRKKDNIKDVHPRVFSK
jgi:hypothetical protein